MVQDAVAHLLRCFFAQAGRRGDVNEVGGRAPVPQCLYHLRACTALRGIGRAAAAEAVRAVARGVAALCEQHGLEACGERRNSLFESLLCSHGIFAEPKLGFRALKSLFASWRTIYGLAVAVAVAPGARCVYIALSRMLSAMEMCVGFCDTLCSAAEAVAGEVAAHPLRRCGPLRGTQGGATRRRGAWRVRDP